MTGTRAVAAAQCSRSGSLAAPPPGAREHRGTHTGGRRTAACDAHRAAGLHSSKTSADLGEAVRDVPDLGDVLTNHLAAPACSHAPQTTCVSQRGAGSGHALRCQEMRRRLSSSPIVVVTPVVLRKVPAVEIQPPQPMQTGPSSRPEGQPQRQCIAVRLRGAMYMGSHTSQNRRRMQES
jgi:hypothetical protein